MKLAIKFLVLPAIILASLGACSKKTPEQIAAERTEKIAAAVAKTQGMITEGRNADAVRSLEDAYAKFGDDAFLCENMALAYMGAGRFVDAGMYYEKSADLSDEKAVLYLFAADAYEKSNSFPQAISCYKKYLAKNPKSPLAWKSMSAALEHEGLYDQALSAYLSGVSRENSGRDPNAEEAANVGILFLKVNNKVQARNWLESAYEAVSPANVEVRAKILVGLIGIYGSAKEMAPLEKAYNDLKSINPELARQQFPGLEEDIANFNKKLEEAKEAIRKAEEEKKKAEEDAARKLEEAQKAEEARKAEEAKKLAEEELRKAEEAKKSEAEAANRADANPLKDFDPMKEEPEETKRQRLIFERLEEQNPAEAERLAQALVFDYPDMPAAWMTLSKVHTARGNSRAAYFAAREAAMKDKKSVEPTLLYLSTAAKILDAENFLDLMYRAREQFPKNCEIMLGLARTYVNLDNMVEAKHFYEQFLQHADLNHPLRPDAQKEYESIAER